MIYHSNNTLKNGASMLRNRFPFANANYLHTNQAQPEISIISNPAGENSNQPQSKSNQVHNKSNQATDNLVTRTLTKKEQDIRDFCSVPRTAQEIMDRLGITNQSKNRQKYITSLLELGVLERTIPDKPNDPNQKYRRKQEG